MSCISSEITNRQEFLYCLLDSFSTGLVIIDDQRRVMASNEKLDSTSVKNALVKCGGNKAKAARSLGVGRATLYRFMDNVFHGA